jgi:hypothetical protein
MKKLTKFRVSVVAAAFVALVSAAAHADSPGDAWATARGMLPANTQVLFGVNIQTIRNSQTFQTLYSMAMAQAGEAKEDIEQMKAKCGFELQDAIQSMVVAMDEGEKGVIFVSLKGVDQGKALSCMNKMGEKEKKTFTAGPPDARGIIEYTQSGEKDKLYVAWLPKGVIAISTENKSKADLEKALSGKGLSPGNAANSVLGKVNVNAAVWGVVAKPQQIEDGIDMKVGYGHADIGGGNITADLRLVVANAAQATKAAAKGNEELKKMKDGGGLPPALLAVVNTAKIAAAGDEVQIKANMAEKEAIGLLTMAMGGGGGPK